ncbi:hypothetical protein HOB10_00120 [Candidatus Parcubacteria bacterium]|nr:hypothetical protein [Candidatus Parcubacteria bacterium]
MLLQRVLGQERYLTYRQRQRRIEDALNDVQYWNGFLRWLIAVVFYFGLCIGGAWVAAHTTHPIGDFIGDWNGWVRIPLAIMLVIGWPITLLYIQCWTLTVLYGRHPFFDTYGHHCICEEFLSQLPGYALIWLFIIVYLFAWGIMSS